jgi:polyphosphate kinase
VNEEIKKEAIKILCYNLKDNQNTYTMREDGAYIKKREPDEKIFNIHREFYTMTLYPDENVELF